MYIYMMIAMVVYVGSFHRSECGLIFESICSILDRSNENEIGVKYNIYEAMAITVSICNTL